MKKFLAMVVLGIFLMSPAAFAKDVVQGTVELSGSSSLTFFSQGILKNNSNDRKTTSTFYGIGVDPVYYVIDNLGIGLDFWYSNNNTKITSPDSATNTTKTTMWGIGPIIGYNISVGPKFGIQVLGGLGWDSEKTDWNGSPVVTESNGLYWKVGAKGKYFVVDNVSLDLGLGYLNINHKQKDNSAKITISNIDVALGLSVYLK